MKITEVRIEIIKTEGKLKGIGSITFDDCFVVHDIRVLEGERGVFVAMPSKKRSNGTFRDLAHPINVEMRALIDREVIAKYEEKLKEISEKE